jgi:hypothetical protein
MQKADDGRKTRPFRDAKDWKCPIHGLEVKHRQRVRSDEDTGRRKYAGDYYGCPAYTECKYYVSGDCKTVALIEGVNE